MVTAVFTGILLAVAPVLAFVAGYLFDEWRRTRRERAETTSRSAKEAFLPYLAAADEIADRAEAVVRARRGGDPDDVTHAMKALHELLDGEREVAVRARLSVRWWQTELIDAFGFIAAGTSAISSAVCGSDHPEPWRANAMDDDRLVDGVERARLGVARAECTVSRYASRHGKLLAFVSPG